MPNPSLSSSAAAGLLKKHGLNLIKEKRRLTILEIFLSQFKNFLILILILASIISIFTGKSLEALAIIFIIFINALFGFWQEYHAEKAIKALKGMVVSKVRVVRDGVEGLLEAKYLVPGDLIVLSEGDKVPADLILLSSHGLETNEASLTGESLPIQKTLNGDKSLFMGTVVIKGRGEAKVAETGMRTRFGKIASLLEEIKESPTPFQKQINLLGKNLAIFAIASSLVIFFIGVAYGKEFITMLLTGISLAVAIVPEGLPAVITITLALGVQRMARSYSIVRKLSAIETLGATDIIATDKTGTLTKNVMEVTKIYLSKEIKVPHEITNPKQDLSILIKTAVIANTASLIYKADGKEQKKSFDVIGDQTEGSLLKFAINSGSDINSIKQKGIVTKELAFDSVRKMMSVVWKEDKTIYTLAKGAPEVILEKSTKILEGNRELTLTVKEKEVIEENIAKLSSEGLRVMAFGYKKNPAEKDLEKDLVFVGMVGISDPPRPEIKAAIQTAREAGIETVMITGDYPLTALAIAKDIGLTEKGDELLTGKDLHNLDDVQLLEILDKVKIFARVDPEQKLRIVKLLQTKGKVVSVTGDGVNDSPALKQADVGIAMGITGTDVAKEAAEVVLVDDNYASIVTAIEEGRVIYDNIIKSTKYLLSCNLAELITILTAVVINLPNPLLPIQILWMNLVTDGLPALALSTDLKDKAVMKRLPRSKTSGIVSLIGVRWLLLAGFSMAVSTILIFNNSLNMFSEGKARSIAFTSLIVFQLITAIIVTGRKKWYSNKFLLVSIFATMLLQIAVTTVEPFKSVFNGI